MPNDSAKENSTVAHHNIAHHINRYIEKTNGFCIIVLASIMVLCIVWQVVSRYVFGTPSTVTDEVARFLFMWVGMLGAVQAAAYKQHLAIDVLAHKLSGLRKKMLNVLIESCILFFAASVMIWGGTMLTQKTFASQQITPSLQMPMGYVYMIIPIAGVMIAYLSLINLYDVIFHSANEAEDSHGMD